MATAKKRGRRKTKKRKKAHAAKKSTRKAGWVAVWMKGGVAKGKSRRYTKKSDAERVAKAKRKMGFGARVVTQAAKSKDTRSETAKLNVALRAATKRKS